MVQKDKYMIQLVSTTRAQMPGVPQGRHKEPHVEVNLTDSTSKNIFSNER